jgi:hypothetical protein
MTKLSLRVLVRKVLLEVGICFANQRVIILRQIIGICLVLVPAGLVSRRPDAGPGKRESGNRQPPPYICGEILRGEWESGKSRM